MVESLKQIRAKFGPMSRVIEIQCWGTRYFVKEVKDDIIRGNSKRLESIYDDVKLCFYHAHESPVSMEYDIGVGLFTRGMEEAAVIIKGPGRTQSFKTDAFTAWSMFLGECSRIGK